MVSSAMIVENLTGLNADPEAMAAYAIEKGARVSGGTDMNVLAQAICSDYGLVCETTSDENELIQHLRSGGMAVANVGGNRGGYTGVFSDGGHFIVCAGLAGDGRVIVLDPGYYPGKFNLSGRKGKVEVDKNSYCYCDITVLAADTSNRNPAYWLFRKEAKPVEQWKLDIIADAKQAGLITVDHDPDEPATKWFVLAIALGVLKRVLKG